MDGGRLITGLNSSSNNGQPPQLKNWETLSQVLVELYKSSFIRRSCCKGFKLKRNSMNLYCDISMVLSLVCPCISARVRQNIHTFCSHKIGNTNLSRKY